MDSIYGTQRYIYDLTRKYFLFGRDRLIDSIEAQPGQHILEVGVGTGRNLIKLGRRHEGLNLYGLDASSKMVEVAQKKLSALGEFHNVSLATVCIEDLDSEETFGVSGFDTVFFSYVLTMIPPYEKALEKAVSLLKPGGQLLIVDFWDQHTYPRWFARVLKWWLKLFHVKFQPGHLQYAKQLAENRAFNWQLSAVGGSYAYLAHVSRAVSK